MFFGMYTYAQPANNSCSGAQQLAIGLIGTCSNTLVTFDGTETDSGETDPGCASYQGADLWYEFLMPASGAIRLETTSTGSITDTGMAIYSGIDCNNLSLIACSDDILTSNTTFFSRIEVAQASGTPIYVRVWEYGVTASSGSFNICATEITPPSVATNDDCSSAEY